MELMLQYLNFTSKNALRTYRFSKKLKNYRLTAISMINSTESDTHILLSHFCQWRIVYGLQSYASWSEFIFVYLEGREECEFVNVVFYNLGHIATR